MPHLGFAHPPASCCSLLELRQYALRPGQRGNLIELFERSFIEPQESVGMHVVGTFVGLDDADRFVWIRGFTANDARTRALEAFYLGPLWAAKRDQANRTMIDSDNVLMLRPCNGLPTIPEFPTRRRWAARGQVESTMFAADIYSLSHETDEVQFLAMLDEHVRPALTDAGAELTAVLRTDPAKNGFSQLSVREDIHAVVVITSFESVDAHSRQLEALEASLQWRTQIKPALQRSSIDIQNIRLSPTGRSEMR
jgi:hypothetical protein